MMDQYDRPDAAIARTWLRRIPPTPDANGLPREIFYPLPENLGEAFDQARELAEFVFTKSHLFIRRFRDEGKIDWEVKLIDW